MAPSQGPATASRTASGQPRRAAPAGEDRGTSAARPVGALLRHLRRAAGLTQAALAARAGYSAVYIGMLERGERLPSPLTIDVLARALDVAPAGRTVLQAAARRAASGRAGPVLDPRSQPPLVDRLAELAALERHLGAEGPPVLVLAGEPGIGKTRLLHETIARARSYGWTVLWGGCRRRDLQEPYSPLLEAIARHLDALPPHDLPAALRDCAWLARALPELAATGVVAAPSAPLPPERERRLVFGAIARVVANVAGPAGTLLVLDDLHWAGPDALDVLLTLAHASGWTTAPVRIVCAYRDTEMQPHDALGVALADLLQAGLATHHIVPPLSRDAAGRLLDDLAPDAAALQPALRDRLLGRAAGVPFFILSCAHDLAGAAADVPWDLAHSVRHRLAGLSDLERELLDVAAVIGRDVPRDLLLALAARPPAAVLAALETACRRRLLEEHGDIFRFAHDVIRDVVEAAVSLARRRILHRRIAKALESLAQPPPPDRLAYHFSQSDAPDRALVYLERAGDQAHAQAAHGTAADLFALLVERLDARGRRRDGARVREKQGAVLLALGRYDAAEAAFDGAALGYRAAGDSDGYGRAMAQLGYLCGRRGRPEEGFARLAACLPLLTQRGATRGLAAAYAALAHLCWLSGRYDEQVVMAARAARAAHASGDDAALAAAEGRRGAALFQQGRFDDALAILEGAAQLAEAAGDLESLWRALNNISTIYFTRGEFERCRPVDEQALQVARRQHDAVAMARVLSNRGEGSLYRGDWPRARADFEAALALVREVGDTEATVYPLLDLAHLGLLEGHGDEGGPYLDEGARLAERAGDLQALRWLCTLRAEMDIRRGYPEHARARFTALLDRPGLEETDVTYMLPVLAWAYLEEGNLATAAGVAARAVARARAHDHRVVLVDALRLHALALGYAGRRDEAAACLEDGLTLAAAMPYPLARARLLHDYGEVEGMRPGPEGLDAARERLEGALALYERLGARADAALAREDIVTLPYRAQLLARGVVLTHGQWARIAPLVSAVGRRGRPRAEPRRVVAAILYVQRTGCGWADLPPALGDDATAHRWYRRWCADGTWTQISRIVGCL